MKNISRIQLIGFSALALTAPLFAFAQTRSNLSTLVDQIVTYINDALFLLMAVAVLVFVWQVIHYFILPNENRKDAGLYVLYAVIGFFVIFSLWGLVNILSGTFGGLSNSTHPQTWDNLKQIFPN